MISPLLTQIALTGQLDGIQHRPQIKLIYLQKGIINEIRRRLQLGEGATEKISQLSLNFFAIGINRANNQWKELRTSKQALQYTTDDYGFKRNEEELFWWALWFQNQCTCKQKGLQKWKICNWRKNKKLEIEARDLRKRKALVDEEEDVMIVMTTVCQSPMKWQMEMTFLWMMYVVHCMVWCWRSWLFLARLYFHWTLCPKKIRERNTTNICLMFIGWIGYSKIILRRRMYAKSIIVVEWLDIDGLIVLRMQ